jgi:hypothetical protein
MNILIKFPTRGRPERFLYALDKYINLAVQKDKLSFLITMDTDDITATPEFIKMIKTKHPNIQVCLGISQSKVHAVNRDMEHAPPFDILLLASDDMIPQVEAYDDTIRNTMSIHFSDTDGVLWFNDGIQGKKINTLCILGKKYYDRFGYIYYPEYKSFYCDNEFTDTANRLNKQLYFDLILIRHIHCILDPSLNDSTYQKNEPFGNVDYELYETRKKINKSGMKLGLIRRAFIMNKK